METKEKQKAIRELLNNELTGKFSIGCFDIGDTVTIYFNEDKDNWINRFTPILSQIGFKFTVLSINTVEMGDYRHSVTLIFDMKNLDETDFW